ncbi:MAG: hypothetical protein HY761_09110 [Candidatus Omnitrophica bacterium]|nr:hypothetical protein [Candidatus Omnitrophota bacterium]
MSYQHKNLAAGRWDQLSFIEQMANIGSEVERALNWQSKNNSEYAQQAFERALELIDLTLDSTKNFARLKEIARLREAIVGYFTGDNQFKFTDESLRKYFFNFIFASRKNH